MRESAQNSWDARVGESIRYTIECRALTEPQIRAHETFFVDQPPAAAYKSESTLAEAISPISAWLASKAPRLLIVSDRGTSGLDGPTRADAPVVDDESRNFVDFLRNVGQPPGRAQSGGTFGYGKAAFYLASETRTLLVYTRCMSGRNLQSRLTAAALTHHYEFRRTRYTGRHWWGASSTSDLVEPYLNDDADRLASALGLPGFSGKERGTTIAITAPVFDDGELGKLGAICLRHLWPKLKSFDGGRAPIALAVSLSGLPVRVPDPAEVQPYDAYWRAYVSLRNGSGREIQYSRQTVGRLAFEKAFVHHVSNPIDEDSPEHETRPRHVALLRAPELVVKYLDTGRSLGNDLVGFAGVFHADSAFDSAFACSEPPTHDDWQPRSIADKRARGIVTTALKKIREQGREFATPHTPRMDGRDSGPLAQLASEFAGLLPGLGGKNHDVGPIDGSSPSPVGSGRGKRIARPQAKLAAAHEVAELEGVAYAVFTVEVTHAAGAENTELFAEVYSVLSGGGREFEPPAGKKGPQFGWWQSPRGTRLPENPIVVGPRQQGKWQLFVPLLDTLDAVAVAVEVSARVRNVQ